MPDSEMLLLFVIAAMTLILTPGPDTALTLTRGMTQGFRVAFLSVLGTWSAGLLQIPLVVLGLAAVFQQSPELYTGVKLLGAVYLLYLGLRALTRSWRGEVPSLISRAGDAKDAFWQGAVTNLLNPKVFIFLTAFLPQFTDPSKGPVWRQLLVLALISKTLGLLVGTTFAYGASRIRSWLIKNRWFIRVQEGVLGTTMIAIAIWLTMSTDQPGPRRLA